MLIEAARRAEAAAKEMLACISAGSAPCAEVREALAVSKAFMAAGSAFQAGAAQVIAKAQRHGDGGAQVLADTVGLTRHDAQSQVRTAQAIEAIPAVRDAVETGRVSLANAKRLAVAVEKTSAEAVESDAELLARAESMRPEQFVRETRRWTADRQADGGASDYKRLRAKRYVRIWDGEDGTVELHGKFDPVAGRRIGNRLEAEARHLYDADKKHADTANSSDTERRSFDHCMADALDNLTASTSAGNGKAFADICVVAHVDDDTGELIAELPDGVRLPREVLEQLSCNAKVCGVVYDRTGKPIWRTVARRTVTESQWQLLIARYGGCFHCGANPAICQGHHIEPVSQGGPTKLDNLVPACWSCHHRIHHDGWQIHKSPDGHHTLHPPDRIHYGPALTPEHPPLFRPSDRHIPATPTAPNLSEPATSDTAHDASPRVRAGPASARAALQRARNERDGPRRGTANGTDPSHPRPGSDPPPRPKDEPLFTA
ncbi:MAG: DUF222 domain-containing protein [Acidimicrobiaceae bacterium]|nr:DUF222 domain-containing protein [Acidimicrobiaceae bacterium]